MLSKSLIEFSVDGWGCVPSLLFTWGQTMVEVMKIMVISLKRSQAYTAIVHALKPGAGHHRSKYLLGTPGHSQASLLWGHCSFLLGPGARDSVVPSMSLFPSPMLSSGSSIVGLIMTSSKRTHAIPTPRAPILVENHCRPILPQEMLKHSSFSVSVESLGPGAYEVCLSPLSISSRNGV